jgi:thiamine pyrophosphate-dependent acetolactate synthase large subunit-like protein/nitrite reductase/ring-hydroxylating ferredoxin subunit
MSESGNGRPLEWFRVLSEEDLPEGRVTTVHAGLKEIALVHYEGKWAALDNRCPHQGGPLGEGSIENGLLRCPWHGYDYDPLTGGSPGEFVDEATCFPLELRADGVYVAVDPPPQHERTVSDVMAETMVNWGVRHVFGMVGHSNLGLADAIRRQEEAGNLTYIGIRHEGAAAFAASAYGKLTGTPAACLTIAGPGATNLLTGLWDAKVDRSPVLALTGQVDTQVLGPGAFQDVDLAGAFGSVAVWGQTVLPNSKHAELMTLACKNALLRDGPAHLIFPDEVQTIPAVGAEASGPDGRLPESTQRVLMSGYLGSIGFGYPAAIGAWAATDGERPILAVTGDGGFGQYMGELLTAVKHDMNITHVMINNGQLGKISKEQRAGAWNVWQTELHNPDFSKYAELCGALGIRVTEASQLDDAIRRALDHNGPAMVEIVADPDLV